MAKKKIGLEYMGKPLYRKGDKLYYGNLEDKYILVLNVLKKKQMNGIDVATEVEIQIQDNSAEIPGSGQVFRQTKKENLYKALDIGSWWLQCALEEN